MAKVSLHFLDKFFTNEFVNKSIFTLPNRQWEKVTDTMVIISVTQREYNMLKEKVYNFGVYEMKKL